MYYVSTRNGGQFWRIRNEYPAPAELNSVIEELSSSNTRFRVWYHEYEYCGYYGRVELIDDETLDTIHVHHEVYGGYGVAHWQVRIIVGEREVVYFDSRHGRTSDLIASVYEKIKEESSMLLLPAPRKKTWREEIEEELRRYREKRMSHVSVEWDGDEICL